MESPSTSPPRSFVLPVVALLVAGLGLAAAGAWWWSARREPPAGAVTAPHPERSEVRLEATAANAARVLVDGQALGVITREPDGKLVGEAMGRLAFQTRRLARREVVIVRGEGVEPALAVGVQNILAAGGVAAPLVEPEPTTPGAAGTGAGP